MLRFGAFEGGESIYPQRGNLRGRGFVLGRGICAGTWGFGRGVGFMPRGEI